MAELEEAERGILKLLSRDRGGPREEFLSSCQSAQKKKGVSVSLPFLIDVKTSNITKLREFSTLAITMGILRSSVPKVGTSPR